MLYYYNNGRREMGYFQDTGVLLLYCMTALFWISADRKFIFALLYALVLLCGGDPRVRGRAGADSGSFAGAGRYAGKENGVEGRD